jgi:hypothetical protein
LVAPVFAALVVGVAFLYGTRAPAASEGGDVHVATSICDAHRLKNLAAEDPHFAIEIPPEFNQLFPTAGACRSYKRASNENAPGPTQPIAFSHAHHAGTFQIDCLYCHSGTERSQAAGVPSVEVCMGCHSQFGPAYDEFEGIVKLKEAWENKQPIAWAQIHRSPEHVQFRHNRHVKAGVVCQDCHGPVEELDKLYMTADTKWWPWGLPTQKLEMGWCIQCHRQKEASQDCNTCHY